MSGDEGPLSIVGPGEIAVPVDLEELGEAVGRALGLADEDVGDGGPLHGSAPGEGEAGRLGDQVVRVAHVRRVEQLANRHVDAGSFLDRLQ